MAADTVKVRGGKAEDPEILALVYKKDRQKGLYENEDVYNERLDKYMLRFKSEREIEAIWLAKNGRRSAIQRDIRTAPSDIRGARGNMREIADMNISIRQVRSVLQTTPSHIFMSV